MDYLKMQRILDDFLKNKESSNSEKIQSLALSPEEEKEFKKFLEIRSKIPEQIESGKAEDFCIAEDNYELAAMLISEGIHRNKFPRFLFKYISIEYFLKSIEGEYLWFSEFETLNKNNNEEGFDPIDYSRMTSCEIINYYTYCAKKHEKHPPFPKKEELENPETMKKYHEIIKVMTKSTRDSTKILSLTTDSKNQKMWEVYAEHGKGICIELDMMEYPQLFLIPEKVKYVPELVPDMTLMERVENPKKYIGKSVATKLECRWGYECEYRIIKFNNTSNEQFFKNKNIIKSITFGGECSDDCFKEVVSLLKKHNYPNSTEIKRMKRNPPMDTEFVGILQDIKLKQWK